MENSHSLRIYFGKEYANLYTIGYVSSDIYQLISFCELIQQNNTDEINKNFVRDTSVKSYPLNRYNKIFKDNIKNSEVKDVKNGSVFLTVADVNLAAAIIIPIVVVYLTRYLNRLDRQDEFQQNQPPPPVLTFNINPLDHNLERFILRYQAGEYGDGILGLNNLFNDLSNNQYDIHGFGDYVYQIDHVAEQYSRRIAKTLNMN